MYPRLSSLPGAGSGDGDTDVYVFCAPRSWRKNVRTLFYALQRGRNYSEDGNIRAAQRVGAEIAETLMICDINAIVNELRAIKNAISALELSVTVPPQRCCPPGNGEPGLPPPAPEPPPPDTPPGDDLPLDRVYCRAARALARNLRAILRDLAALALFNALTPAELQRALTRLGLDQTTVKFISITTSLLSFIYRVLSELLDNLPDPALRALHDALIAASDAIDEELFTCCFTPYAPPATIAECAKQKVDELELNVFMSAFVRSLIWPEKVLHFVAGKARGADGELVDINWDEANISAEPCCEEGPYLLREPTYVNVEAASQCTYEVLPGGWYRVTVTGPFPGFEIRKRYSATGFTIAAMVLIVQNNNCNQEREVRDDANFGPCRTLMQLFAGEERKVLITTSPNPPAGLLDYVSATFPGAVVQSPVTCDVSVVRDTIARVRYGPGSFEVKPIYIVQRN